MLGVVGVIMRVAAAHVFWWKGDKFAQILNLVIRNLVGKWRNVSRLSSRQAISKHD